MTKKRKIEYVSEGTQTQLITTEGVKKLENTSNKNIILAIHEIKKCKKKF